MQFWELFVLAIGLSMDAFAVAVCILYSGICGCLRKEDIKESEKEI